MRDTTRAVRARRPRATGFSLIELVIVVVIIAIIGAIAIPKMSRGAAGANDSATVGDLATLRAALELYAQEHGGNYPNGTTGLAVTAQLLNYTDVNGAVSSTAPTVRAAPYIYGPYLKTIPPLPVGGSKGSSAIAVTTTAGYSTAGSTAGGWLYDGQTFWANDAASDADVNGKPYQTY